METDYTDTYTAVIRKSRRMTAENLFQQMFVYYPKPVLYLLRLRDWLVKPFGLKGGGGFEELITEKDDEKLIFGKSDKHLDFYVRLQCDGPKADTGQQSIRIMTSVKYHNPLGRIYFFFIRPFHTLICKRLLKRAAHNWEKANTLSKD